MPTVQQLLNDINARMPNTFTTAQILTWFNDLQREIDKDKTKDEVYSFSTIAYQGTYAMPDDCTIDQIKSLSMAQDLLVTPETQFTVYSFKGLNEEFDSNNYYDAINGLIGLWPVPDTTGYTVNVIYSKKSRQFTEDNLGVEPDLKPEYHNIFKYDAMKIISASVKDVEVSNFYEREKKEMLEAIEKDRMEEKVKTPLKSRANRWW